MPVASTGTRGVEGDAWHVPTAQERERDEAIQATPSGHVRWGSGTCAVHRAVHSTL